MSSAASPRPAAVAAPSRQVRTDAGAPLLGMHVARGIATLALAAFGGLHWMALLEPTASFRAWEGLGIVVLVIAGLLLAGRAGTRALRRLASAAVAVAGLGLALLAGGVADEFLRPDNWGALAAGIGRGIETLPGVRVPFRGLDEWARATLAAGGTGLMVGGAALAFWPRAGGRTGYRIAALVVLVALYVVPTVALIFDDEFLRGTLLLALVLVFLRLERLRTPDARPAGLAAGAVALLALALAPALDRSTPWWDYETWALSTSTAKSTTFSWDHDYRPLDWPRDGRELLRVRAKRPVYWKADNLDTFDGVGWRRSLYPSAPGFQVPRRPADPQARRKWSQRIQVSVRNLQSREVVTAGAPLDLDYERGAQRTTSGVYVTTGRPLRRGDVYRADVYAPDPSGEQLRGAGTDYDYWLEEYRSIAVAGAGLQAQRGERVRFGAYGTGEAPELVSRRSPSFTDPAAGVLERSGLRRTWALAQRLRAGSSSPYGFVRRVESYLRGEAFSYTEAPPASAETLEGFLFDAKAGFCQQYSGAMALLLRMGGVPARVSTGFTSGSLDEKTKEYVVRDLDAHSWVEAWFPGYGWVTFDPTPSATPARAQTQSDAAELADAGAQPDLGLSDRTSDPRTPLAQTGGGTPWGRVALAVAVLAALAALGFAARRRRRRTGGGPPWARSLAELERALRRMGRGLAPGTTLHGLEAGFADSPGAQAYVRALRRQRYGVSAAPAPPTPAQRRGLRAELARGAGPAGRLKAWWALPPKW